MLLLHGSVFAQASPDPAEVRPALVMDLAHTSVEEHVDLPGTGPALSRFVQIHIDSVVNPKHVGVLLEVAFLPDGGSRVHLGSFSLYPPDHPGTFIVATQHRVRSSGSIIISLSTVPKVDATTPLSIGIASVALIRSPAPRPGN
jgi:hypothetical protein